MKYIYVKRYIMKHTIVYIYNFNSAHQFSNCSMNRSKPLHFSDFWRYNVPGKNYLNTPYSVESNRYLLMFQFQNGVTMYGTKNTHGMLRTPTITG